MANGKVVCLAGETGSGKGTFIKDKCNEAGEKEVICYLRIRDDFKVPGKKVKVFTNFIEFLRYAHTKKDCIIIIDEAFTCLPKKLNISMTNPNHPHNLLADILVNARKLNNFVFIVYHSLSQIPTEWLIPYLNWLLRFFTNDLIQYQLQRFKSFPKIHNSLLTVPQVEQYKNIPLKLR